MKSALFIVPAVLFSIALHCEADDLFRSGRHLSITALANAESIVSADFDRDGFEDVGVTVSLDYNMSFEIFYGSANGFGLPVLLFQSGLLPCGATAADYNNDQFVDIAVGNCKKSAIYIFVNDGHRGWNKPVILTLNQRPVVVHAAELNNDGNADLLVLAGDFPASLRVFTGDGDGGFHSGASIGVPASEALIIADFNSDSIPDIAIANYYKPRITLLPGTSQGEFLPALNVTSIAGVTHMALIDLLGNGKKDIILSDVFGRVALLKGQGNATFENPVFIPNTKCSGIAVSDWNQDGLDDFAVVDSLGRLTYYYQLAGSTSFRSREVLHGDFYAPLLAGDWNSDRKPDIAVTRYLSVEVLLNTGKAPLPQVHKLGESSGYTQVLVADFNGDGKADMLARSPDTLFIARAGTIYSQQAVQLEKGALLLAEDLNGDGKADAVLGRRSGKIAVQFMAEDGFGPAVEFPAGANPASAKAVDLNRDGSPDLVIRGVGSATTLLNNRTGSFAAPIRTTEWLPSGFAVADFDGDGFPDLVSASENYVTVFKGAGNGSFERIKRYYLEDLSETGIVAGDFNSDGRMDFVVGSPYIVFSGRGDMSFEQIFTTFWSYYPNKIIAVDINNDHRLDLVAQNETYNELTVLLANDTKTWFAEPFEITAWPFVDNFSTLDWNHDGTPDLILAAKGLSIILAHPAH